MNFFINNNKYILKDGSILYTDFDKPEIIFTGKGKLIYSNGDIYEGDFIDGYQTGKGKLIYSNGDIYEGDVIDGKIHGKGKITYYNGVIYEGEINNGKPHGMGKKTFPNGGDIMKVHLRI